MRQQVSASVATSLTETDREHDLGEIAVLESWLSHELRCESTHRWENTVCSVEVTHLFIDCAGQARVCAHAAGWLRRWISMGAFCGKCDRPASECWEAVPI